MILNIRENGVLVRFYYIGFEVILIKRYKFLNYEAIYIVFRGH